MTVLFEFLDDEPMENMITCLNYKIDRVVFFGFDDTVRSRKGQTEDTLNNICGVRETVFHTIEPNDLQSCLETMSMAIEEELARGNRVFFDITGGESMILVAFGMLSSKYVTPIHRYDIEKNMLIELDDGASRRLSTDVMPIQIKLDLDQYIRLNGGIINHDLEKSSKKIKDGNYSHDISVIWGVVKKHRDVWNPFSEVLRECFIPDDGMRTQNDARTVTNKLERSNFTLKTVKKLNSILDELAAGDIIKDLVHSDGIYAFEYKNESIKSILWDGGSILEMHIYQQERCISDDCGVGVHIDWDGVIHPDEKIDVINEIDVMSIKDNRPRFISCKSGNMKNTIALHALYELESIADRFGGKYGQKILITTHPLNALVQMRADEMGIEVRTV